MGKIKQHHKGYRQWDFLLLDQSITREQMAVIMQNFAKAHGFKLPRLIEKAFADSDSISAYANEAVQEMQMSGIINGKGGNIFRPTGWETT